MPLPGLDLSGSLVWPPDPYEQPHYYRGVTRRRIFAYLSDVIVIGLIVTVLHLALGVLTIASLGLLFPFHLLVIPLAVALLYHSLTMAGRSSATFGMRLFGLRVYTESDGGRPTLPQTFVHSGLFYLSWSFGGLLLLFALFESRRRTLHDLLSGLVVLRERD